MPINRNTDFYIQAIQSNVKTLFGQNKLIIEKFSFLENVRAPKNFDHKQTYRGAQFKIQFELFYEIDVATEITAADFRFPLRQQPGTVV